jgi:hypothetical protein
MRSKADIGPEATRRPVPDGAGAARHRAEIARDEPAFKEVK